MTNLELNVLYNLALAQECPPKGKNAKGLLIDKLAPVNGKSHPIKNGDASKTHDVLISEDEAEVMLDCMSAPDKDDDPSLVTARIKIQQFLAKTRFGG